MSRLLRRTLYGVAAGVLSYVAARIYFHLGPVAETLRGYRWWLFGVALLLCPLALVMRERSLAADVSQAGR